MDLFDTSDERQFFWDWVKPIIYPKTNLTLLSRAQKKQIIKELPAKRTASMLLFGSCVYMDAFEAHMQKFT